MTGALNDAREKAVMSDARAAYIAFELNKANASALSDITKAKIAGYTSKDSTKLNIAVVVKSPGGIDNDVKEFYYQDTSTTLGTAKYILIDMGGKATVVLSASVPAAQTGDATKDAVLYLS